MRTLATELEPMQQAPHRSTTPSMSPSDTEAWARLRLVQGRAGAQLWELVHSTGHTSLTVGAAAGCSWVVHDTGVAPIHFTLHWDGSTLRIADTYGAGDVRVDGRPVDRTFRVVSGRARIDFGQAAIVVETSSVGSSDAAHPLDSGATAPASSPLPAANVQTRSSHKATMMGVPPATPSPPIQATIDKPSVTDTGSFRPSRPPPSLSPKATLMGMSPLTGPGSQAPSRSMPTPTGVRPSAGKSPLSGTLMGFANEGPPGVPAAGQRIGGASLADGDQRTIQGFPRSDAPEQRSVSPVAGRRPTIQGVVSAPPGVVADAVRETRVKPISDRPVGDAGAHGMDAPRVDPERTTLEEVAAPTPRREPEATGAQEPQVPKAVLLGHDDAQPSGAADQTWRMHEQTGEPAVDPRDVPTLQSRRPTKSSIPWHYVGLGVLTAAAYVAWLYLLDHL